MQTHFSVVTSGTGYVGLSLVKYLLSKGAKAITIACNTATGAAAAPLRAAYPELVIVGIEPAVKPARTITKQKKGPSFPRRSFAF